MKKYLILVAAALLSVATLSWAQEPAAWTKAGSASINLSQTTLTNWAAGGDPNLAAALAFNYSIDYKKEQTLWQNRLELAYGWNTTESNGTRKTNDKIYFSSNYGRRFAESLYVSALMTFNTQFAAGYDYGKVLEDGGYKITSNFMAPAYLSAGLGVVWNPASWLSVNASPATWKATVVTIEELRATYAVDADRSMRHEFGGNVRIEAKGTLWDDVTLYNRINLFSNFLHNPQNVDVDWTFRVDFKINKWLSANATFHAIYDDDIKIAHDDGTYADLQLQEVAGLGLLFTF